VTRRRLAFLVAAVVAVVGIGVCVNSRSESIGRRGSAVSAGQPILVNRTPAAYTVEYRLEEKVGGDIRVSTQRLSVRRPFESRLETRAGAPPGDRSVSVEVARLGRRETRHAGAGTVIADVPPDIADVRVAPGIGSAVTNGTARRRERRMVARRPCQVYRTGKELSSGLFVRASKRTYVDTCVDRDGLVLEELHVTNGKPTTRRVAMRVDTAPSLGDGLFRTGAPNTDAEHGGGSTRRVDPASSPPGRFWQLDSAPSGFNLEGRYAVVPPQPENFTDPALAGSRQAAVTDVFQNGADALLIERGGTISGTDPWAPDPTNQTIDLGQLGRGEVVPTTRGSAVRVLTGRGPYVQVLSTLPLDDVVAVIRQLHAVPGGELRYID
jgi:hypothetical protein